MIASSRAIDHRDLHSTTSSLMMLEAADEADAICVKSGHHAATLVQAEPVSGLACVSQGKAWTRASQAQINLEW